MPRRRCCRCPGAASPTPSPPDSPRTLGLPLVRTRKKLPYDNIASQIGNPENERYFNGKARERRTRQALNLIGQRVLQPGNEASITYMPREMLYNIRNYANTRGGKKTRKYKKRPKKKKKRTNRRKSNKKKKRTNRRK
jgi:hypothetical protein